MHGTRVLDQLVTTLTDAKGEIVAPWRGPSRPVRMLYGRYRHDGGTIHEPGRERLMAIGVVFEGTGTTQAQYDQVRSQVAPGDKAPPGLLYHAGGVSESGVTVIEVWESQAVLDRFFQEHLGAAHQAAGINVQPRVLQVTTIMTP
jgi:quinol monooxygenase YgiN